MIEERKKDIAEKVKKAKDNSEKIKNSRKATAKTNARLRRSAKKRMNEAIAWGEINDRRPLTTSKDKEEKSLALFLSTARRSRKGMGNNKFYKFWIKMTEDHPMDHIKTYIEIKEKKVVEQEEVVEGITPELEKEILEELSEVNQTSNDKGKIFQPIFEEMADHLKEEPEVEVEIEDELADFEFEDIAEEEIPLVPNDERVIGSVEDEYLSLKSSVSNEFMLKLARTILEEQTELEIQEGIDVVKNICDLTMKKLVSRVQHLYFMK